MITSIEQHNLMPLADELLGEIHADEPSAADH